MQISIYNTNTELEQLEILSDLVCILDKVKGIQNKNIVFGDDFIVISDISPEISGEIHVRRRGHQQK